MIFFECFFVFINVKVLIYLHHMHIHQKELIFIGMIQYLIQCSFLKEVYFPTTGLRPTMSPQKFGFKNQNFHQQPNYIYLTPGT